MPGHTIRVPKQHKGGFSNTTANVTLTSVSEAIVHFDIVKSRLLEINRWGELSKELSDFRLAARDGNLKEGLAEEGDFIRIELPAPGSKSTGKFEWVTIETLIHKKSLMNDSESLSLTVSPSANPAGNEDAIAHFFKDDATSTFLVHRQGTFISAEVYGRNEQPNTDVSYLKDLIRNVIVAISAILGFSKLQWKLLVKGLVQTS